MRPLILLLLSLTAVLAQNPAWRDTRSPDGKYIFRAQTADPDLGGSMLQMVGPEKQVQDVIGCGYGAFDPADQENSLRLLWAPDSRNFAVMYRSSKRGWTTAVFSVVDGKVRQLELTDPTGAVYDRIKAREEFRWTRQTPIRWKDAGHLEILLHGDVLRSQGNDAPMRYEVKALWDIKSGKVRFEEPIAQEKEEG